MAADLAAVIEQTAKIVEAEQKLVSRWRNHARRILAHVPSRDGASIRAGIALALAIMEGAVLTVGDSGEGPDNAWLGSAAEPYLTEISVPVAVLVAERADNRHGLAFSRMRMPAEGYRYQLASVDAMSAVIDELEAEAKSGEGADAE